MVAVIRATFILQGDALQAHQLLFASAHDGVKTPFEKDASHHMPCSLCHTAAVQGTVLWRHSF